MNCVHGISMLGYCSQCIAEQSRHFRPVEPSANGEDKPEDAYIYSGQQGYVVSQNLNVDQAREVSDHMNALYSEIITLRKQNASLQSRLDVMQQDRDDWRARTEHFIKLASEAAKAVDVMRPFQVKGRIE